MRAAVIAITVVGAGTLLGAQSAPPPASPVTRPSFEVASIKRSQPGASGWRYGAQPGGRWSMVNSTIGTLVRQAYQPQARELVGAPAWVETDLYDVNAKAEGEPTREQMRLILQSLLADRFKFVAHYETQERPVFALVVARKDGRLGPNLTPSKIDCDAVAVANRAGLKFDGLLPANGAPPCAMRFNGATLLFGGWPMSRIAEQLAQRVDRPVADKTGLTGNYEATLHHSVAPSADQPSIFTAVEEQLGLKLVPDRAPLQVLVIDHIERPTED